LKQKSDMSTKHRASVIGFVWRPGESSNSVIQMARRTGSRAVIDFSMMGLEGLSSFLRKAGPAGSVRDIRISMSAFLDPSLAKLLRESGVSGIWVECNYQWNHPDHSIFLRKLQELSPDYRCFPVISDIKLLTALLKDNSGIGSIALKGCEASGFVSSETTMSLYSMAKSMLQLIPNPPDILIWGGVSTPEAAAAFLSTGAAGIVFESIHWLTDMVAIDDVQRQRLAKLRLDSTDLVGLDLQAPCRLFNKGNSLAFRELKTVEASLYQANNREESRRSFVSQLNNRAVHPLESHFDMDEVIPLGVEAAFAASFVERFGPETEKAVESFMGEIRNACRLAVTKKDCFLNSPVAGEMGIKYPFIQGAMSWITDVPEFASRVADAGGLPTIALGLMDAEALDRRLGRLPEIMAGRPYAVNVVSLAENPFRETHLAWIKKKRPRFAVIAGGDLSPLKELIVCGVEVIYIAPDEALLRLALEAGVRYVVFEGYEAGGHVGPHSMLTLAQMALDLKRRMPELFHNCRVVLAGGILDRETAFMAAMLGADAIQMGTAYLVTQEIVETGALNKFYQRMILKSPPGGTVVSGRDTGLRVRSLRTPRVEAILELEREFAAGLQDETSFRTKIEDMAAGSLFAAAQGMDKPEGAPLDEQACLERGQFMSGSCAGLISKLQKLETFHRELAEGPLIVHLPVVGEIGKITETSTGKPLSAQNIAPEAGYGFKRITPGNNGHERIAITGMSILNTLGKSPEEVWDASLAMKSGITLVPSSRWDHTLYHDPRPQIPDKTYCKVGAFLDLNISRNELGIPPQDFRTMTTATKITLWLADKAIRASGILESDIPPERVGVIISQNSGESAGTLTNIIIRAYVNDILNSVKKAVRLTPDQVKEIEREVKAGRMAPDDTTLLGRLNCAAPGFICNRYGFMGPSYAVSAACASSLVALHSAIQMVQNGVLDAAIVGGGEDNLTHLHFLEFAALGALFGLSGRERPAEETSRPFDGERDGMVLGEGGGMIVIERESLARARGAQVHAIITGMGASNNNLGMVESASVTQKIAIGASFRGTPYGPEAVDLVECHATSTRQGDVAEVRALKTFFNPSKRTALTSFKSQIGHTLGASGINNLIRGTMAMKAGVFPPTLNYRYPDPEMGIEGSGFLIDPEPLDWKRRNGDPRRLQVNAFGFGGSNYVVQLEQTLDDVDTVMVCTGRDSRFAAEKSGAPQAIQGISFFRTEMDGRNCRMAVVAQSDEEALTVIGRSAVFAEDEIHSPKTLKSLAQQGIFISPEDLPAAPLAFVFPGQGAHYAGMGRNLYESFPVIREWMDRAAAAADFDLLHLLFNDREENLGKTRWQQPALFAMEQAMARHLVSLGIHPAAMAGHSLGELTALCMAGVYSVEDGFRIVNARARCMDKVAANNVDPGVMAAVDAPMDLLEEMINGKEDIYIANINSPNQIVMSGTTEAIRNLGCKLKEMGYRSTLLRVSMAFHSPIMRGIHDELDAFVATIPFNSPQIPVISNTTMAPYPSDPNEIRRILMAHLESTVHWMNNVQTLWNDNGVRLFVEVGPGDILSNLIADTLPEAACIQTCIPPSESISHKAAIAGLFAQGHLKVQAEPKWVSLAALRRTPDIHSINPASAVRSSEQKESGVPENGKPESAPLDPAVCETPVEHELMERLIRIIMDATGFNREEIQPDMDLRRDLSIRSSRLPIIMDAAERQFAITIEMEDFIGARTVKDIAGRISGIIARQGGEGLQSGADTRDTSQDEPLKPSEDEASLKRLVFNRVILEPAASIPIEFGPGDSVLLLSPDTDDGIAVSAGDTLRLDYGVGAFSMRFMQEFVVHGEEGHDIRTDEGACRAADRIANLPPHSGMVIIAPNSGKQTSMEDVSRLLRGLFLLLKTFLQSPKKKFVTLIHFVEDPDTSGRLLTEGMLGLFLSAAQEYQSVQFRILGIERETDLRVALLSALDRGCALLEIIHRDGKVFTSEGRPAPAVLGSSSGLKLDPGDVVVMSGGATGISAHLARSLAPFKPRLVFLGRTSLDKGIDRAPEIAQTLTDLHSSGIEATYYTCDVCDPEAVRAVLGEVAGRYGRIDGIIHGAGVLRDSLLSEMTPDDFSVVTDVKFLGAWNLFSAAEGAGLKFFVALSSVAAIQGNPGQTNYAAANRMMSALLKTLHRKNSGILFKALMLPPIEGAGMAGDPELRDLLKRKGVEYIHANELAGLFCRELFAAPANDDWVMFMRRLPAVKTALINDMKNISDTICSPLSGEQKGCAVSLSPADYPMIDSITRLDIRREELEASRSFSAEKDLWISDHRPFKFIKHPLVSAAMVLETFMEAARVLYPHLQVRGVRQVRLLDMIQCPPGVPRPSSISCRRSGNGREVLCEVSLSTRDLSPAGRLTDRFTPRCKGQVVLDGGGEYPGKALPDFPVRPDELLTKPMDHKQTLKWYKDRSGLEGRYRVMDVLDGAGPGVVRGRTICRETSDFANLRNAQYQYSPYLFEALLQLAGFHIAATNPSERRSIIPMEIGEMRFSRKCLAGEQITVEARMREQDEEGLAWDARGIDDQGLAIMQVHNMRMNWVSD
jgi:malonyl CoA-acyl carrier protein transacylase